ncbi:hypothetical protein [Mumia sp. DW29H23]|uniref:hypothetical protein n=1 Tax=Mumia sp. DW29H23 TaxID=3421241 RepID=UPI003D69C46B
MQLRWILTAAAAVLALSGCSDGGDSAKAEQTPTPTETSATATPSPTPSPTPTATTPPNPFPGIAMTFTGGPAGDARVEVLKTFVAGSAYSQREYAVPPQLRAVLSRDLQRFLARGVNDAKKNGWVVPAEPVAQVAALKGGSTSTARLCRWSPSVSWVDAKTGKYVEARENQWNALAITMRSAGGRWVLTKVEPAGQCDVKAPR